MQEVESGKNEDIQLQNGLGRGTGTDGTGGGTGTIGVGT